MFPMRMALAATALCAFTHAASAAPTIAGCPLFPANHALNTRVDNLPLHPRSASWIANVGTTGDGATRGFHMDFGAGLYNGSPIGIPYVVVPGTQPRVPMTFDYADDSDPGPYPIPPNAPIEGVGPPDFDGDRHVLVVDSAACRVYEVYYAWPQNGGASWTAGSGATWSLTSNALRPSGWTSADAAGLSILQGLVRYEEVAAGVIEHAIRFTAPRTQRAYIWPARHFASTITDPNVAPMGARFRLKASVDISGMSPQARVIAQAMKTYGIVLADNGSSWFVTGTPDSRWDNDALRQLNGLKGGDFEAVDASGLMVDPNSAQAGGTTPPPPPPPAAAATATSLTTSANPSASGQPVTFRATVTSGSGTPSGTVAFRSDSATIAGCAAVTLAGGSATCATSSLAAGSHAIVASYAGNSSYNASTSGTLTQTVSAPTVAQYTLTVTKSGRGTGTVSSADGKVNCGSACSAKYNAGTSVTLTAVANSTSVFRGWNGACSGTGTCTVTLGANKTVQARFARR